MIKLIIDQIDYWDEIDYFIDQIGYCDEIDYWSNWSGYSFETYMSSKSVADLKVLPWARIKTHVLMNGRWHEKF